MDHVIKESLVKQFSLVMKNYSQTTKELRNKRVIKIKDKISERFGKDMNFETLSNLFSILIKHKIDFLFSLF